MADERAHDDGCRCMACCREKFKTIDPARFGKAPECPFCGGQIRGDFSHAARCGWGDLNALLGQIRATARSA